MELCSIFISQEKLAISTTSSANSFSNGWIFCRKRVNERSAMQMTAVNLAYQFLNSLDGRLEGLFYSFQTVSSKISIITNFSSCET